MAEQTNYVLDESFLLDEDHGSLLPDGTRVFEHRYTADRTTWFLGLGVTSAAVLLFLLACAEDFSGPAGTTFVLLWACASLFGGGVCLFLYRRGHAAYQLKVSSGAYNLGVVVFPDGSIVFRSPRVFSPDIEQTYSAESVEEVKVVRSRSMRSQIMAVCCCDDASREPDMEFLHLIVVERGSRVPVNRYIDCGLINSSAADVAACLKETHLRSSAPSVSY